MLSPSVLASGLLLAATATAHTIQFGPCNASYSLSSAFECGTLAVPINHADPAQGTIDLWVSRRPANTNKTTASARGDATGTLLFNFGGPGVATSLVFQLQSAGLPVFADDILDHFDIIGIEPRGVRYSSPITCNGEYWDQEPNLYDAVADDAAFAKLVNYNSQLSSSCLDLTTYGNKKGALLHNLDRATMATDFELVRQGLPGVDKIHYLGLSYGTVIGRAYAARYGEHVAAMVLDAVVDRPEGGNDISAIMADGGSLEATLKAAFAWCNATGSAQNCSLYGKDQEAMYAKLTAPTPGESSTLPAGGDGTTATVPRTRLILNTGSLISTTESDNSAAGAFLGTWSSFAQGLEAAYSHDNASAFASASEATNLTGPGSSNTDTAVSSQYVYRATLCLDFGSQLESAADLRHTLDIAAAEQPLVRGMGAHFEAAAFCAGWAVGVVEYDDVPDRLWPAATNAKMPPKSILLANAFLDPETPAQSAMKVGRRLRPASVNVYRDGGGHTSYLSGGATTRALNAFLVNGTVPVDGTVYES